MDIVFIWVALLALTVILYVILDGFGLGIGLLFPFTESEDERTVLMSSIAPVWDANQTWLVFGGSSLLAAFPLIYGVLFSALYIPVFALLFGLIFRGVSFEFRINSVRKNIWDRAFFLGSLVAVAAQGLILGGVLTGINVAGSQFAGGPFDWLNAYSIATAIGLVAGYALLGSTYLIIKTTGTVQDRAYGKAFRSSVVALIFQIMMIVWTPFHYPRVMVHWLSPPRVYFMWVFPALGLLAFYGIIKSLRARREIMPFAFSVVFFFAGYLALFASIYPYAVPPDITFRDAAAQRETLEFTLCGAALILPVVLGYTVYKYSVFKGKVGKEGYYH
ncbi:MAG TPA: cytochrome d ubiquinol oxidase subunit II [Nitrospirota bacterium]|nr:cytochrome d ubiquinol oxidase subunit II [Nitrospirota bacterium]